MFKKCLKCGKVIYVVKGSGDVICCNEPMQDLIPNSVDAAFEKHVPNFEIKDTKLEVIVKHVMDDDHYIEWIALENEQGIQMFKLKPGMEAKAIFDYTNSGILYAYCNKHGLWKKEI
ncbi:MAG: desulfoferrodoxin [Bacilli bacterium]|nr:desulfoferrodoxin [Bacilli bacterium]